MSRQIDLIATPQSIWRWWTAEARNACPAWLGALLAPHAHIVSIRMDGDGFAVSDGRDAGPPTGAKPAALSWSEVKAIVTARRKAWGSLARVDLHVPLARCLVLHHRLPADAQVRARDILTLELERLTPLRRAEVLQGVIAGERDMATGSVAVEHIVVKTSALEPALSDLTALGGVDHIKVVNETGDVMPVDLAQSMPARKAGLRWRLNQALMAALALAAATVVAQTGREMWALYDQLDMLSQTERGLKQQVADVRKKLSAQDSLQSRINALKLRKAEQIATLETWEEITQLLPGSAWVSELRIEDGTLYLDGFARSASELVGIFARSNLLAKVEFGSPVTRDSQQGVERFQLRMKIERRGRPPVAGREGAP